MRRHRRAPARAGFTLMEMMGVMAGLTVLIGLGVATINSLFLIERNSRQATEDGLALEALADSFRDDLHAALRLSGEGAGRPGEVPSLSIELPGGQSVEYRTDGAALLVTRQRAEGEPRRERLVLASLGTPRLSWETRDGRAFARLSFSKSGPESDGKDLRIEAPIGRDDRFLVAEDQP